MTINKTKHSFTYSHHIYKLFQNLNDGLVYYDNTELNVWINICFLSFSVLFQRSIEDEIERKSNSDILTILISYLLMFGYVSLMLGQYNDYSRPERLFVSSEKNVFIINTFLEVKYGDSSVMDPRASKILSTGLEYV